MRKILAANWKENPKSERKALELFRRTSHGANGKRVSLMFCPPFLFLEMVAGAFKKLKFKKNISLGAQDVFWEEAGPYTGEVGPQMLKSLGVRHSIVGHSERRIWLHETDAMINKKIKTAHRDGIGIILCVGESLAIRKKGSAAAKAFIKLQLKKDLAGIPGKSFKKGSLIVAYEPIWAIGTGRSAKPRDAADVISSIKKELDALGVKGAPVLYGGSVNANNVADFVQLDEIDGALVGGASLKADEFKKMITAVAKVSK
ncbi:MAG TPA: triose-phosphate isomerase [Candidatus Paceibacterota bacterium]|nr:triose-phosphate isomerase [Candidatus Paceibacterota bacterium]